MNADLYVKENNSELVNHIMESFGMHSLDFDTAL